MIKPKDIWYSPINVYWHIQRLTEKVGAEAIEREGIYKSVREARIGAVIALAMFSRVGRPTFLQLYKPDPPDLILMQPSKTVKGDRDLSLVEVTSYIIKPRETLLDQLKRTKVPPKIHLYSDIYILIVNVGVGIKIDYEPIRDYLNANDTPFPVWTLQEVQSYPDTIARLTIVNPEIYEMEINISEAAHVFDKLDLPGVIHSKRVGNPDLVRAELTGKNHTSPWGNL